ncbi:MAG: type IV pilus biogenesis/stability protein PilW [Candidatus Polarisedimenticolaceae bacterium]|nr:type IV pilus biogenesis/stability protein PilW [Candidatus Polarisedimenticolaceae bacterium]
MISFRLFLSALLLLLLVGCATQPSNEYIDADTADNIGAEREKSPADIYVKLGVAYMQERQYGTAMKKLRRGLELDPNNADIHNVMALLYDQLNDIEKASSYFNSAVSLSPKDPYIRNARATHYCKLEQYAEADADFNVALANPIYSTPWVAMTNAGLCALRQDDAVKAEIYFRRALSGNAKYFIALEQMLKLNWQQKSYPSARAYLNRYLAVQQPSAALLWLAIRIEGELKNREAMEGYKRQLLELFPDAPEVLQMRGME